MENDFKCIKTVLAPLRCEANESGRLTAIDDMTFWGSKQ